MPAQNGEPPAPAPAPARGPLVDSIAGIAAGVALVAFGILTWILYTERAAEEGDWERLAFLYTGIEAIAFGAAGWLFGREVNRRRAEEAEERADTEEQRANTQQVRAEHGQAVADAVRSVAEARGVSGQGPDELRTALDLANAYFRPTPPA